MTTAAISAITPEMIREHGLTPDEFEKIKQLLGGRALKRLNKRRVIMRLDLERTGPAVTDVDDARILARPLHHQLAARRQALQVHTRGLVRAVLAPHHAENTKFGARGFAPAEQVLDFFKFVRREPVLPEHLGCSDRNGSGGHGGEFLFSHLNRLCAFLFRVARAFLPAKTAFTLQRWFRAPPAPHGQSAPVLDSYTVFDEVGHRRHRRPH